MALDDLADAGESDAGAGKLARRMQPLERAEILGCLDGIKPSAVIADMEAGAGVPGRGGR
ncbi:MAG TPA: hypothetical protein VIK57_02625 [Streptosporangiaceae bacterium]